MAMRFAGYSIISIGIFALALASVANRTQEEGMQSAVYPVANRPSATNYSELQVTYVTETFLSLSRKLMYSSKSVPKTPVLATYYAPSFSTEVPAGHAAPSQRTASRQERSGVIGRERRVEIRETTTTRGLQSANNTKENSDYSDHFYTSPPRSNSGA